MAVWENINVWVVGVVVKWKVIAGHVDFSEMMATGGKPGFSFLFNLIGCKSHKKQDPVSNLYIRYSELSPLTLLRSLSFAFADNITQNFEITYLKELARLLGIKLTNSSCGEENLQPERPPIWYNFKYFNILLNINQTSQ